MIDPRMVQRLLATLASSEGCPVCGARWLPMSTPGQRHLQHHPDCELVEALFIYDL